MFHLPSVTTMRRTMAKPDIYPDFPSSILDAFKSCLARNEESVSCAGRFLPLYQYLDRWELNHSPLDSSGPWPNLCFYITGLDEGGSCVRQSPKRFSHQGQTRYDPGLLERWLLSRDLEFLTFLVSIISKLPTLLSQHMHSNRLCCEFYLA
ncbi:hypothetical protein RRG08_015017 [Elysia crispata]|uniref:Uncharacterized protein n=1 Tax=Elysia crispata TaxID=231223 RepID=A0AAE0ZAS5_9GAST|nr:hypothetical protein RRG08_015017 [Elysia crispata]